MKNRTKKIALFAGLLAFSFGNNFCMQEQEIILSSLIRSPDQKWEVKTIVKSIRYPQDVTKEVFNKTKTIKTRLIDKTNSRTIREYLLSRCPKCKDFSPNSKYVYFSILDDLQKSKGIVVDLDKGVNIKPFDKPTTEYVHSTCFSTCENLFLGVFRDNESTEIKVFDLCHKILYKSKLLKFEVNPRLILPLFLDAEKTSKLISDNPDLEIINLKTEKKITTKEIAPGDGLLEAQFSCLLFGPQYATTKYFYIPPHTEDKLNKKINKRRNKKNLIDTIIRCQK